MRINSIPILTRSLEAIVICVVLSIHFHNPFFVGFGRTQEQLNYKFLLKIAFCGCVLVFKSFVNGIVLVNFDESLTDL